MAGWMTVRGGRTRAVVVVVNCDFVYRMSRLGRKREEKGEKLQGNQNLLTVLS